MRASIISSISLKLLPYLDKFDAGWWNEAGRFLVVNPIYFVNYSSTLGSSGYDYGEVVPTGYGRRVSKTNAQGGKTYYDFSATSGEAIPQRRRASRRSKPRAMFTPISLAAV